ncbi:hypothetical protein MPSEU_000333500 [Mayamaea pseudoterrestris]|nr:hypothetical protein MPSEU_000333500 [Mayamaea pseudoterrestris]
MIVLDDETEVGIFRINAGTILASVSGNAFNEFEDAADYFRQAISLADAVSKKELRKCKGIFINPAHDAQSIVQDMRDNCATNLKGMENPITVPVMRGDATERPPPLKMQTSDGISFEVQPDYVVFPNVADMEGRLATGGKECDFCKKTLAQLGIPRLSTCTRCKMTYYCSKECQKAAWKAGHKTACREPNQRVRGDVMQLKEHGNELSQVVTLVEEQPNKQWKVTTMLFCRPKTLIVDSDQLVHIRPTK